MKFPAFFNRVPKNVMIVPDYIPGTQSFSSFSLVQVDPRTKPEPSHEIEECVKAGYVFSKNLDLLTALAQIADQDWDALWSLSRAEIEELTGHTFTSQKAFQFQRSVICDIGQRIKGKTAETLTCDGCSRPLRTRTDGKFPRFCSLYCTVPLKTRYTENATVDGHRTPIVVQPQTELKRVKVGALPAHSSALAPEEL